MTRAVTATLLAALLLASSCSDDDDAAADRSAPTSQTTSTDSETSAPTTVVPTNPPTATSVTTLVPSTTASTSTTVGSGFVPIPEAPPPDEPVREGATGATELASRQTCDPASPASPAVVLTWRPAITGGQLVAVAVLPDGFETDRYTVTDELSVEQASYGFSPLQPGGVYRWRVLTRSADGWTASDIAEFTGPTCIVDRPSPP